MAAEQTLNEGQSLLDQLALPVKNAFGKDVSHDNKARIEHVQRLMGDLQERKLRCDELADVRKLKLQQILQMLTCERDAEQVRKQEGTFLFSIAANGLYWFGWVRYDT